MIYLSLLCFFLIICYFLITKLRKTSAKLNKAILENRKLLKEFNILKWSYQINQSTINVNSIYRPNRKIKAIIADYYEPSAIITNQVLHSIGIETDFVTNGDDLISKVMNNDYDVVITNNVLQGNLDGVQVLDKLKKIKNFSIPIIILTTSKKSDYFIEYGFDDYIEKALDINKALNSLKKVIPNLDFIKENR